MTRRPDPRRKVADEPKPHGTRRATAATMLLAEFLLLVWLGMTIIGDTAGRSALITGLLTILTVVGITWDQRRRQ